MTDARSGRDVSPRQATPRPWRWYDFAGLFGVFALALALRWGWPGVIDFKLDEASASRLAVVFARDGWPPLYGVTSSTGIPTPPNAIWVLAPPYFLAPDPLLATAWIALLSALSVAVGYWLARRYFGFYAALITGLLHAVSPFSVYQARKVWTPGTQPLFAVLTVATGAVGFIEGRRRWQAAHVFLLAFTIGVHFSALPLALVTAFLVLANWRRVDWRMVALGVAGAVVLTVPFVVGVARNPNIVMTQDAAIQDHQVRVSAQALEYTVQNTAGYRLREWGFPDAVPDHPAYVEDDVAFFLALEVVFVVGAGVVLAAQSWRRRQAAEGVFGLTALLWLVAYIVLFTVQWAPIFPHYYIALWPAPYLVMGAGATVGLASVGGCVPAGGWQGAWRSLWRQSLARRS
ncbi:MAG: glycosyltransferase family 39 protein [Anaerolineae bacterium]|nr:glycosyltransferase family 39 protein [Anaerolineae bacterium]